MMEQASLEDAKDSPLRPALHEYIATSNVEAELASYYQQTGGMDRLFDYGLTLGKGSSQKINS